MADIYEDYKNYFTKTPVGANTPFAGGTAQRTPTGATWTSPTGTVHQFTPYQNLSEVYGADPNIASAWNQQYGIDTAPMGAVPRPDPKYNYFQPDLVPGSTASNQSASVTGSQSGINWNSPFLQSLLPQLQGAVNRLPGLVNNFGRTLQDQQTNLARQALGPTAFQGTLNNLLANGTINSSVASDALANTARPIMQDVLNRGYDATLAGQNAQLNLPSILGQLAQLGQESSSAGISTGSGESAQSNPLAPYELAASILLGTQNAK